MPSEHKLPLGRWVRTTKRLLRNLLPVLVADGNRSDWTACCGPCGIFQVMRRRCPESGKPLGESSAVFKNRQRHQFGSLRCAI
jgi:hypothetical protein